MVDDRADPDGDSDGNVDASSRLELPADVRVDLKAPMGPLFTDPEALIAAASPPVIAVGDIVTYHLLEAGFVPAVAVVDERTEREAVDPDVRAAIGGFDRSIELANPPGTITAALVDALVDAVGSDATTLIRVDGEEDLAALPAILAAPAGATVVYGQPGEGMVRVTVDAESRDAARSLVERMDGDVAGALARLE